MPIIKYRSFNGGMTPDISPHQQADNEFILAENYRLQHRAMEKVGGQVVEITNMPISDPNSLTYWDPPGQFSYFVTAKGGNVFATYGTSQGIAVNNILNETGVIANIFTTANLAQTYTDNNIGDIIYVGNTGVPVSDATDYTLNVLAGGDIIVASNNEMYPLWSYGSGTVGALNFQPLPKWHYYNSAGNVITGLVTADVMASYKGQLIAGNLRVLDLVDNPGIVSNYPSTIRISDISNPGVIPSTWVPGTETFAAQFELNTQDPIQDIIPLRDSVVIFTQNQCFLLSNIQKLSADLRPLSNVRGLLHKRCAVEIDGFLYFVTTDDIMVSSGASTDFKSLIQTTLRDYFFQERLNANYANNTFVSYNRYYNEFLVCYANKSSVDGLCNEALVYNISERCWTQIAIPPCTEIVYAPTSGNRDGANTLPWLQFNAAYSRLHSQVGNVMYVHDTGNASLGSGNIATTLVKVFDFGSQGSDASKIKHINQIFPFFYGNTTANIQFITQNTPFVGPIDFSNADYSGDFVTTTDYKIDPIRGGRYIAIRIATNDSNYHNFNSIEFDVDILGRRG